MYTVTKNSILHFKVQIRNSPPRLLLHVQPSIVFWNDETLEVIHLDDASLREDDFNLRRGHLFKKVRMIREP